MHTSELQFRPREHQKFQSYIEKFRGPGEQGSHGSKRCKKMQNLTSIGALWDVFQREDTAMLQDYLRDHSEEFYYPDCWVFNSVKTHHYHMHLFAVQGHSTYHINILSFFIFASLLDVSNCHSLGCHLSLQYSCRLSMSSQFGSMMNQIHWGWTGSNYH